MDRIRIDWARAWGAPLFPGVIRSVPEDFVVTERLGIDFSGEGEHDWLRIRKTGANTHWVAGQLARHASVAARDVGYAGMKDRNAVAEQWFSIRRRIADPTDWNTFQADGVELLEHHVHNRKLRRGAHRGNNFRIAVRGTGITALQGEIAERLAVLAAAGVPNYFGEQRFGRGGSNVELGEAVLAGRRVSRHMRSIGISALRSYRFNKVLDVRVREGTWNVLQDGDRANLDGTGSDFALDDVTAELATRCDELDIHPCGVLPAIEELGVQAAFRPLRMRVQDFHWEIKDGTLWLEFGLGRGSYATAVLRELAQIG